MLCLRIGLLWAIGMLATLPAAADPLRVVFEDGRVLTVSRAELQDDIALLTLDDEDRIAVPAWRIVNWSEIENHVPDDPRKLAAATSGGAPLSAAWRTAAGDLAELVAGAAERHQLDPVLLTAMAKVESDFDPNAVSHKGASGLMQLMPATAERFGVRDVFDAADNIDGGARYLSWLLERFEGRTDLALAGYNAGERAVERYAGVPPYPETQNYVDLVLGHVERLAGSAE
jgi:soluble lytic murein transglycosylase-like protein